MAWINEESIAHLNKRKFEELVMACVTKGMDLYFNKQAKDITNYSEKENLTRKECAEFLRISLPTLTEYTNRGMLRSYKLGGRKVYRKNESNERYNPSKVPKELGGDLIDKL